MTKAFYTGKPVYHQKPNPMQTVPTAGPLTNIERLWKRVETLSSFTDPHLPWTRRAFTERYSDARQWLQGQMEQAGLNVYLDQGGNMIGRREGRDRDALPIITGSHTDTVLEGGRFDGIIGVLAGIEVAQSMSEQGIELTHPFEVIDFLSEEPSDYGISCVGSRAFSGLLDAKMLATQRPDGETLAEGIRRIGGNPDALDRPLRHAGSTAAFVELHIEQGPVLESRGLPIGVVTHIVGIRRVAIGVHGRADHAGTTPMNLRQDALVGAARLIDAACALARELGSAERYVVATVGRLTMTPNMSNAVPAKVDMILEVRSDDEEVLKHFPELLSERNKDRLEDVRVTVTIDDLSHSGVTTCSDTIMAAIERSATSLGHQSMRLPSGAGHDAVYVAKTGPVGMIFIPCLQGRSHSAEEWIEPEQLLKGSDVLLQTIVELDRILAA